MDFYTDNYYEAETFKVIGDHAEGDVVLHLEDTEGLRESDVLLVNHGDGSERVLVERVLAVNQCLVGRAFTGKAQKIYDGSILILSGFASTETKGLDEWLTV